MAKETLKKSPKVGPVRKAAGRKPGRGRAAAKPAAAGGKRAGRSTGARPGDGTTAARLIDGRIRELSHGEGAWRGATLARMRSLILDAVPELIEEWKWSVPVWSHPANGILCTGEAYSKAVKFTFARGASLPDPSGLFNSSLEGKTRRAIDIREGETVDAGAFRALIRAAAAQTGAAAPKLLSGGNPQIPKAYGEAPVRAYIAAMPGWKRQIGRGLDAIISRTVPGVRKAVKWNSPMYGAGDDDQGWFLSFHCFDNYVKVAFFRGASLRPPPPGQSKQKDVRYLNIHEGWGDGGGGRFDETRIADWVKQASRLPGERM